MNQQDKYSIRQIEWRDHRLVVSWGDGHLSRFHASWLRHGLYFPAFPNRVNGGEETYQMIDPLSLFPEKLEMSVAGTVEIQWSPDDHQQSFEPSWLRDRCYSTRARKQRKRLVCHWNGEIIENLPTIEFECARNDDTKRLDLFCMVLDFGFCLVRSVPPDPDGVLQLADLFGISRTSPYASSSGDQRVEDIKLDPELLVNTGKSEFLGPHTDTVWRQANSGLILLHCLQAEARGGETLLVDGFNVAHHLRQQHPAAFKLLSSQPLNFFASVKNGDEWRSSGKIVSCDEDGEIVGFRYSDQSMRPLDIDADKIDQAYSALGKLQAILYDQSFWVRRRLQPGEVIVTDNHRVLHGRSRFDTGSGMRHLQTCNVERDHFHINYRHLAKKLNCSDWDQILPSGAV